MEECKSDIPPHYVSFYFRIITVSFAFVVVWKHFILIRLTALFTWNGACVVTFLMIMINFAFLHDITFHILVTILCVLYFLDIYLYSSIYTTLMYFRQFSFIKIPFFSFIIPPFIVYSIIYVDYLVRESNFFYISLIIISLSIKDACCPLFYYFLKYFKSLFS